MDNAKLSKFPKLIKITAINTDDMRLIKEKLQPLASLFLMRPMYFFCKTNYLPETLRRTESRCEQIDSTNGLWCNR